MTDINSAKANIETAGFLDLDINPEIDLFAEIEKLKNDKLQIKIQAKDKELVTNSLQVVKKNKILIYN